VVAAIANGGDILRPSLVHEIRDANGNVVPGTGPQVVQHVDVGAQNIATMRQAMLQVVESGSATTAQVPGVKIAGKSGTAEYGGRIDSPSGEAANGTYNEHGWFVSYAPFDNPQVALVVFHERGGGAATAGPVSSQIWDYYFHQYLPSRATQPKNGPSPTP
jgi:cell division protein FtsI/penicillin-binding protein 2